MWSSAQVNRSTVPEGKEDMKFFESINVFREWGITDQVFLVFLILPFVAGVSYAEICSYGSVQVPSPEEMGQDVPWQGSGIRREPPENPQVGDSWLWWLYVGGTVPYYEQAPCTIRGVSDRCYVVVKDDQWLVTVDQDDVNEILDCWESWSLGQYSDTGIYDLDCMAFGLPPDELDEDERIYLLYYDMGTIAAGLFFLFDEFPDGTFPNYHSNECEVIYLNPESPGGPSGDMMLSVAAHEFQHMIHWNHDPNEASWVNEGMAMLAMWLFGYTDPISGFNSNPDNGLVDWEGTWPDYVQSYLWSLYFFENCGGFAAANSLINQPGNSMAGYEAALDSLGFTENVADLFGNWIVANFMDDTLIAQGQFGYRGVQLPEFSTSSSFSSYPVDNVSETVNHWAADYYSFTGFGEQNSIVLSFDGSDNSEYRVRGIVIPAEGTPQVHEMILDGGTSTGSLWLNGLEDPGDEVILVVGDVLNSGGSSDYSFSAETETGIGHQPDTSVPLSVCALSNPFSESLELSLSWNPDGSQESPVVQVYDLGGRLLKALRVEESSGGKADAVWDGTDADGITCPCGIYLIRAHFRTESHVLSVVFSRS